MPQASRPAVYAVAAVAAVVISLTWWKMHQAPRPELADASAPSLPATSPPAVGMGPASAPSSTPLPPAPRSAAEQQAERAAEQDEARKVVQAGRTQLQSKYESERVDGRWALQKEATLKRLSTSPQIEELNAKPRRIEATCRSTVCRLEADFGTRVAASDWFTLYTMNVGQEMPNVSLQQRTNPDGTVHVELYGLARP